MKTPFFSIVTPAYNSASTVGRTIESCTRQGFQDFEIIIIDDDKSSDDMEAAVAPYRDKVEINLILKHVGKAGAARNTGVRLAKGQYIAFLDADDEWLPNKLEICHARLMEEPDTLFYSQNIVDRGLGKYWIKPTRGLDEGEPIYDYLFYHKGWVHPTSIVVNVEAARKCPFNEKLSFVDDMQLAVDFWRAGTKMTMIEEATTIYNDPYHAGRLSQGPAFDKKRTPEQIAFFEWMDSLKKDMSDTAWRGYRSFFYSRLISRTNPIQSFREVWQVGFKGPASMKKCLMQTIQTFTPHAYRKLTDLVVRIKGYESIESAHESTINRAEHKLDNHRAAA